MKLYKKTYEWIYWKSKRKELFLNKKKEKRKKKERKEKCQIFARIEIARETLVPLKSVSLVWRAQSRFTVITTDTSMLYNPSPVLVRNVNVLYSRDFRTGYKAFVREHQVCDATRLPSMRSSLLLTTPLLCSHRWWSKPPLFHSVPFLYHSFPIDHFHGNHHTFDYNNSFLSIKLILSNQKNESIFFQSVSFLELQKYFVIFNKWFMNLYIWYVNFTFSVQKG